MPVFCATTYQFHQRPLQNPPFLNLGFYTSLLNFTTTSLLLSSVFYAYLYTQYWEYIQNGSTRFRSFLITNLSHLSTDPFHDHFPRSLPTSIRTRSFTIIKLLLGSGATETHDNPTNQQFLKGQLFPQFNLPFHPDGAKDPAFNTIPCLDPRQQ